jgi:indole-3-glycerol phosphate synthase
MIRLRLSQAAAHQNPDMSILDKIVAEKRAEVEQLRPQAGELKQAALACTDIRDFAGALHGGSASVTTTPRRGHDGAWPSKRPSLIAEIKKSSPSAGVIAPNFDAVRIANDYEKAGASALSVLTDEKFFQGRIEFLQQIRSMVKLPLLRKDFIINDLQVWESAARGADAILLIVAILDDAQLKSFRELAEQMRLAVLVEVHDERELDRAIASGATIIGINNRDLRDFSVNLETTERLAAKVPQDKIIVAESGINTRADVERLEKAGVSAILVGESLMKSADIGKKVRQLLHTTNGRE